MKRVEWMLWMLGVIALFGGWAACSDGGGNDSSDAGTDEDADGDSDGDADTDTDGDSDSDADGDADTDADADAACDDGVLNGDEIGVDCGGSCDLCFEGAVYYVAADGDDGNDGLSEQTPWRSIGQVNRRTLSPGDSVLFKRGDTWRDTLIISASGNEDAFITYGAYGEGEKPRILGSERAEDWHAVEGASNVWESATVLAAPREREGNATTNHPASIFFGSAEGTVIWGNMEALHQNGEGAPIDIYQCDEAGERFSLLDSEFDWCWQDDHIYVYAPENPGERYAFVEVPQRSAVVKTATHPPEQYIALDGLALLFAFKYGYDDGWPMNATVRGLNIANCHIGFMGTKGAASAIGLQIWHSDMLVRNNDIHDCGRRSISYNVYGDVRDESLVFENVVFDRNTLHNGYHTTGFDINAGYTDTFRNFVFMRNHVWDNPNDNPQSAPNDFTSMGFYFSPGDGVFTDFSVHHNILSHTKQKGMAVGGISDSVIYNNTFYDMNPLAGGDYRGMLSMSGSPDNVRVFNNIFYGSVPSDSLVLSGVTLSGDAAEGVSLANNLYYQEDERQRMVTVDGLGSFRMEEWDAYRDETGWDEHSPAPAEPMLTNPEHGDFTPMATSPAVDSGLHVDGLTDGYAGDAPDIGAIERDGK